MMVLFFQVMGGAVCGAIPVCIVVGRGIGGVSGWAVAAAMFVPACGFFLLFFGVRRYIYMLLLFRSCNIVHAKHGLLLSIIDVSCSG